MESINDSTCGDERILNRTRLLLGDKVMNRLSTARIILFGVGGVGSWCAETLVRSGVKNLTIVDGDRVCASNINRQLMATTSTIGQIKVDALKSHLLTILPDANIDARFEVFNAETASSFALDSYDYIIDAIDSLRDKALLIEMATRTKARVYSSMGAALKLDPARVRIAEFWKVQGCPLARALRQLFRKEKRYPAKKFMCVYSDELLSNKTVSEVSDDDRRKNRGNGSIMHITAMFGLMLGGMVIRDLTD